MSLIGIDLTSSRARAVGGAAQSVARVALEGQEPELALAIALTDRYPKVGRAGLSLVRKKPHVVCSNYLPALGSTRVWAAERHRLDAEEALALAFTALAEALPRARGVVFALPPYLDEAQLGVLYRLAQATRLPLLGSLPTPVAAALASRAEPGTLALVLDVDDHALTWSIVERLADRARLRLAQPSVALARGAWLRRLLDGISHRCVLQSRHDPRESADAEQGLYEQLLQALAVTHTTLIQLHARGPGWYHHLMLPPDDLVGFVGPLLRQAVGELNGLLALVETMGPVLGRVVLTPAAASLPGLAQAVKAQLSAAPAPPVIPPDEDEDYGDALAKVAARATRSVLALNRDDVAVLAQTLAERIAHHEVKPGHYDAVAVPTAERGPAVDAGPARLTFRGSDHYLSDSSAFLVGRDPGCDLVFESEAYPTVSARHCEIIFDRKAFVLYDRSRHGTLVNDRPVHQQAVLHSGDWVRLGPRGPVLRFLGQAKV